VSEEAASERLLILADGFSHDPHYGKTARGLLRYGRRPVVAVLDSRRAGETIDGVPIVGSVSAAVAQAPTTAVIGVATEGGTLPSEWRELVLACVENGLHIENGLHQRLADDLDLAARAAARGVELRELRQPPTDLSPPSGANLALPVETVLTVGTDCANGKMTACLELEREARRQGIDARFVPTGQTGVAIAGWGMAIDAVVADFIAGATERLLVGGHARGGRVLFVEGQGSLVHPAYSGVTLGLLHGAAPHALVLCHRAGAREIVGYPGHPLPPLDELVDIHERIALPARPARVAAIALNTADLDEDAAVAAIARAEDDTGLPAGDPVRFGSASLLAAVLAETRRGVVTRVE
jgi:D-glutamate N-acetyltransferase